MVSSLFTPDGVIASRAPRCRRRPPGGLIAPSRAKPPSTLVVNDGRRSTTYFTTAIAVAAGTCLAFGVLYVFIGIRRPEHRRRSLLFATFAIAYAGASLTARASFLSNTPDAFVSANRVSLVLASVAFVALGWYVAEYTGFGSRIVLWVTTAAFVLLAGLLLAASDSYYGADVGTETVTLPWGEVIRVTGSGAGVGIALAALAQVVLIGFIVFAGLKQYRRGERREALVLAVGIGWFVLALVVENLSSLGVLNLPPAADFGFLGFLFALSFAMVNEAIDSERELVRYQAGLEDMVATRTAELEGAQQLLVVQAEEAATAAERVRISRDLHDAVSQLLFSIRLLAGSLPKLWRSDPPAAERSTVELQRLAGGALAEMRTLLRELRPEAIPQTNLELLIAQATEGVSARMDVPVSVDVDMDGRLPEPVHVVTYRVCQEAIANVAKHANASRVEVAVVGGPNQVRLTVRDDGVGFDPIAAPSGTLGLATMAERVDEIGGRLDVVSAPGEGTVVTYEWEAGSD